MTFATRSLPFGLDMATLRDYAALLTGQVGRLVFSLGYFLALMKALTLAEFGMFATASAIGVTLSRVAAFGFVSPLYRTACVRRRLLGSYLTGYFTALLLSLPVCALIAWITHALLYEASFAPMAYAAIIVAEVILWRTTEVVVIVANGLGRFLRGSLIVIGGTALRAAAAFVLIASVEPTLERWSFLYLLANLAIFIIALAALMPRVRPRWSPRICLARWRDALGVAGAELVFYAQSELDRVLVLALGGPALAGLYAIILRLADLTAIPLRALNTLLVQSIIRRPTGDRGKTFWIGLEASAFGLSVLGMATLAAAAQWAPDSLGENVKLAALYLPLALLLPGFRNLVELHTELLYAFERPLQRLVQLALVGVAKVALISALIGSTPEFGAFVWWLNAVFAALYVTSAVFTHRSLAVRPAAVGARA